MLQALPSHVNLLSGANTSRCSASCDAPLSPLLHLPCHHSSLTHLHWGQDTLSPVTGSTQQNQELHHLTSSPLAVCPRAERAGRGRTMFQPPQCGKRGCDMRQRGAGSYSAPDKQCNKDTVSVEISFTRKPFQMMQLPTTAEHSPRTPQLGQGQGSSAGHSQAVWDR